MSHKFYVPVLVNNQSIAKEVKAWYFPLLTSGQYLSKKIIKAYCSVNGVSKLFYEAGGGGLEWTWYETLDIVCIKMETSSAVIASFKKVNVGIAYYAAFIVTGGIAYPLFMSTDSDAVTINRDWGDHTTNYDATITYNGDTWYYNYHWGCGDGRDSVEPSACVLSGTFDNNQQGYADAATAYLDKIYASYFNADYRRNTQYTWGEDDIEKCVRRAIGVFLFKNYTKKSTGWYSQLLNNVDSIVDYIMSIASSQLRLCIEIYWYAQMSCLILQSFVTARGYSYGRVLERTTSNGFEYVRPSNSFYPDKIINVRVYDDRIDKESGTYTNSLSFTVGMKVGASLGNDVATIATSNLGVTLP